MKPIKTPLSTTHSPIGRSGPELPTKFPRKADLRIIHSAQHKAARVREDIRIADWIQFYPLARTMKRRLRLFVGPTNSGKTHHAFERLVAAESGCYLAPLRLLALEGFDRLQAHGIASSMRTGEEIRETPGARHASATVEMADLSTPIAIGLIDEIQLIADPQRGWAWTAAVAGLPADEVIMMGSADAIPIVQAIARQTGDTLEIRRFDRLSPLRVEEKPVTLDTLQTGDALIAFSRAKVMRLRNELTERGLRVATIYGALGPDVRKREAERFRSGEAPILIATDAIGMGLNLPIRRVIFSELSKFDGKAERTLSNSEIRQIAGRAGRYGIAEDGRAAVLSGLKPGIVRSALLAAPTPPKDLRPWVMPPLSAILRIGEAYETESLAVILEIFSQQIMTRGEACRAPDFQSTVALAKTIAGAELEIATKWCYVCAPVDSRNAPALALFEDWAYNHGNRIANTCPRLPSIEAPGSDYALLAMESAAKSITVYLWLAQKFPAAYPESMEAWYTLEEANRLIEQAMRKLRIAPSCRSCGHQLPRRHLHTICDPCYRDRAY